MSETKYMLFSKMDNQNHEVNSKIISASTLLKNVCDLTKVNKPIEFDCSAASLNIFVNLINHYEAITDEHDSEFEEKLFKNFTEEKLIELIKEIAILDSDFFLDSIADFILRRIKEMKWNEIKEYLYLEDDFTFAERVDMEKYSVEYLLGINVVVLEFPFPNKNFSSIKTKFSSPFNSLLARIVQRSKDITAYNLSLINKSIKNENDRYPIKVSEFKGPAYLALFIDSKSFLPKEEDFNIIETRKVMAEEYSLRYNSSTSSNPSVSYQDQINILSNPLDYCIPPKGKNETVQIHFQDYNASKILDFKVFYERIVAKDFSKQIEVYTDEFKFFQYGCVRIFKKPNATKFHKCYVNHWVNPTEKFKDFIINYMELDCIIRTSKLIPDFDIVKKESEDQFIYDLTTIKNYLKINEKTLK